MLLAFQKTRRPQPVRIRFRVPFESLKVPLKNSTKRMIASKRACQRKKISGIKKPIQLRFQFGKSKDIVDMLGIFLDIEATGLDFTKHHVIDIALKVIDLTTGEYKGGYESVVKQTAEDWKKRDPVSIKVNGFTWEQVQTGKPPSFVADEIIKLLDGLHVERGKAVFICQNPSFDRGFFTQLIEPYTQEEHHWPYHWLDLASMYWGILMRKNAENGGNFPEQIALSKNEIAKRYRISSEEEPHRAMNGVNHLIKCYEAVLGVSLEIEEGKTCSNGI